ncbi:MAG: regulator [Cryobacterium sp.]|nr:regulator [Cryobacterium sp.]
MIPDDFDSRPGSATSLLRTIVGAYLRGLGGWISIAELIRLMEAVGVPASHARTAVQRVKAKGLLQSSSLDSVSGYRLNPEAIPMLERGDRRIFKFRQQRNGGAWCLISFSFPEAQRALRHQLRKHLSLVGCGTVSTGLWICPAFLTHEVEDILRELKVQDSVIVFITDTPQMSLSLKSAISAWWDLDRIASCHLDFLSRFEDWTSVEDPAEAFSKYVTVLDSWRIIPYIDPGLQPNALPKDWPGFRSVALFDRLKWELEPTAELFVHEGLFSSGQRKHSGGYESKNQPNPLGQADSFA